MDVLLDLSVSLFPAREASAYPFAFQRFPESVGVISAIIRAKMLLSPTASNGCRASYAANR